MNRRRSIPGKQLRCRTAELVVLAALAFARLRDNVLGLVFLVRDVLRDDL